MLARVRRSRLAIALGVCCVAALGSTVDPPPARATLGQRIVQGRDGRIFISIAFQMDPHWHIYWRNPGDSGGAPRVQVDLPAGFAAGEILFPRPRVFGSAEDRGFGYEGKVELLVPVTLPTGEAPASVEVSAVVSWMACKESCVMGEAKLNGTLTLAEQSRVAPTATPSLPGPMPEGWKAEIVHAGAEYSLVIVPSRDAKGVDAMLFLPDPMPGIEFADGTGPIKPANGKWRIPFSVRKEDATDGPPKVRGLILAGGNDADPAYWIELGPVGAAEAKK